MATLLPWIMNTLTLSDFIPNTPGNRIHEFHKLFISNPCDRPAFIRLEEECERVLKQLPDLSNFKLCIQGYTTFDLLKYHIDETNLEAPLSVAYRPKGVQVSFWTAPLSECNVLENVA